jgi:hypothetical protein
MLGKMITINELLWTGKLNQVIYFFLAFKLDLFVKDALLGVGDMAKQ